MTRPRPAPWRSPPPPRGGGPRRGVRGDLGRRPPAKDAARGEELDDAGARMDLLAHGLAHLDGAIGHPSDLEAVPARRGDPATGRQDARSLEDSTLDGASEL